MRVDPDIHLRSLGLAPSLAFVATDDTENPIGPPGPMWDILSNLPK